jgi:hypothetical protein
VVRACLVSAIAIVCTSVSVTAASANPRAVVELFTSQGCSSCPPADELLGQLAGDPSLVALSLPIDYWDYLGWKDTLADPRNTARQRAYSHVRGDRQVYTPQVVVNGSLHALGSDRNAIENAIVVSRKGGIALALPVTLSVVDGQIRVGVPDGEGRPAAEVWLCGLAHAVTVAVGRGENRGKVITYHNVARRWVKLGTWSGKGEVFNVPVRDLEGDSGVDKAAVVIQAGTADKPSMMLGAALTAIP